MGPANVLKRAKLRAEIRSELLQIADEVDVEHYMSWVYKIEPSVTELTTIRDHIQRYGHPPFTLQELGRKV